MVCEWHAGLLDINLDVQARRQGWFIYMHQSREGLGGLCLVFLTVDLIGLGLKQNQSARRGLASQSELAREKALEVLQDLESSGLRFPFLCDKIHIALI